MALDPILPGEIYWVETSKMRLLPSSEQTKEFHPFLVLSELHQSDNNASWPTVLGMPVSASTKYRTRFCVKLAEGEYSMTKKCWIRIPGVQAMMKTDLRGKISKLNASKLEDVQAELLRYLGLASVL